jgi:phospholipid/cholesterol/gamma-HCH transport system substrate-binding protein
MRRAKFVSWSELRVGILVIVSFALLALTILYIGRQQGIFAETYVVKVYMERINGLQTGAPVWLSGVRVGSVKNIQFRDRLKLKEIEVTLEIDKRVQERIRKDSVARIGTLGLLGDKYVSITQGSMVTPAIPEDGILLGANPVDFEQLIADASTAVDNLVLTLENTRIISEKITEGSGTLGRLVNEPDLIEEVQTLITDTRTLIDRIQNGEGTFARLLNDEALYSGMTRLLWSSDTLATDIRTRDGTLGKLIYDPTLYDNMAGLTARMDTLLVRIERGEGTAGKLIQDEALYDELKSLSKSTRNLVEDIKQNPARYIKIKIF